MNSLSSVQASEQSVLDLDGLRSELKSIIRDVLLGAKPHSEMLEVKDENLIVPMGIFQESRLGILESLVKYLKEEKNLSFKDMGAILRRDNRMLWSCYDHASKKVRGRFSPQSFVKFVPVRCFSIEGLSCFESACLALKDEYGYSYQKIADMFGRNYQTIWTTYRRAKKKHG